LVNYYFFEEFDIIIIFHYVSVSVSSSILELDVVVLEFFYFDLVGHNYFILDEQLGLVVPIIFSIDNYIVPVLPIVILKEYLVENRIVEPALLN